MSVPASRPRLLPERAFPAYAYLPGRQPHPVRDPGGHSFAKEPPVITLGTGLALETFHWGIDLFNHGYYWEAHEAWEGLWHAALGDASQRLFFKSLILMAAAAVKIREGKQGPALRHAARAAAVSRRLPGAPDPVFEEALGMPLAELTKRVETAAKIPREPRRRRPGQPEPVFEFLLAAEGGPGALPD